MSPGAVAADAAVGSGDGTKKKGKATPDTIIVGCIAVVLKDGERRRATILSIRDTKSGRQYYCNFDNYNKRLDEWVPVARIDFDEEVEWPTKDKDKPKDAKTKKGTTAPSKKSAPSKKHQKRPPTKREQSAASEAPTPHPWPQSTESQQKDPLAGEDVATPAQEGAPTPLGGEEMDVEGGEDTPKEAAFSREAEIEKLRTSGSMTQNPTEIARVRNISRVNFGEYDLFPWYFSPYPEAFGQEDIIHICEMCLSYFSSLKSFSRHRQKCTLQHPPGNEIYRDDYVSFYEIDGKRQRTWCRNLCLLCKMFLDHKTLFYDVDPFLFYVMTSRDEKGCHLVGFFSKEKHSSDAYNVACILTLPQYQRRGYGRLLIQFSYMLSQIEGKLGSPEKPLSDLGLLSYRQYWIEAIVDLLLESHEKDEKCSIEDVATKLAMTTQDVEHTLQAYKMQVYHRGEHKIVIPKNQVDAREKRMAKKNRRVLDKNLIKWTPPVFTAQDRTWGW